MKKRVTPSTVILNILAFLFVLVILIISVCPILWVFFSSFKDNAEIFSGNVGLPKNWTLYNYIRALEVAPILSFYKNSVFVAILTTLLNIMLLSMSAYVLTRFVFKGRNSIKILLTCSLFIPGTAILVPVYMTMSTIGLGDTLTSLIITYAAFSIPTSLYIISSYYMTIPTELEEAAFIDGAGFYYTYYRIIFPLVKPALATAAILSFLGAWNEFQYALILTTSTPKRTLPIALKYFTSQFSSSYGQLFAATIIVVLPSIITYIILQKQITDGLVSGAVKG